MGQIQTFDEFLDLLRRRSGLVILVTVIGIIATAFYVKSRPDSYEAAAVIQILVPTVSESGAAAPSVAAQLLQAVEQRLTTRENLLAVIDRHQVFADSPGLAQNQQVDILRGAVRFESVASATGQTYGAAPQISALIVFARLGDPDIAARVANDFAQNILDESSAGQLDRARETSAFFTSEENRVWTEIAGLEAEIAAYKNANSAALPTQRDALRDERQALETDLRRLDQDQVALDGQRSAIGSDGTLRATDQRALQELDAQATVLAAQRAALFARRVEIDGVLAQTPEVERVLSGYDRQLQQLQEQYEVINRRMAEAETAQRLAEQQQAERFTLLERAVTPQYAIGGGGRKMVLAGAVGSLMLAMGLAFLLDLLKPVVRSAEQMERQLDLRPVVSIPEVGAAARSNQRARTLRQWVDDPKRPIFGLPRFAVVAGGATVMLLIAAAAIS
ncbi:MAG: Wzz/FepE/Etk N-terminal domain-containing protein [Paracoccaceae bacterium]